MSWCAGYLEDQELVLFLRQAKAHLRKPRGYIDGSGPHDSFIYVIDNVAACKESEESEKDQLIRCQDSLEDIFHQAGLQIMHFATSKPFKGNWTPLMMWCL